MPDAILNADFLITYIPICKLLIRLLLRRTLVQHKALRLSSFASLRET